MNRPKNVRKDALREQTMKNHEEQVAIQRKKIRDEITQSSGHPEKIKGLLETLRKL